MEITKPRRKCVKGRNEVILTEREARDGKNYSEDTVQIQTFQTWTAPNSDFPLQLSKQTSAPSLKQMLSTFFSHRFGFKRKVLKQPSAGTSPLSSDVWLHSQHAPVVRDRLEAEPTTKINAKYSKKQSNTDEEPLLQAGLSVKPLLNAVHRLLLKINQSFSSPLGAKWVYFRLNVYPNTKAPLVNLPRRFPPAQWNWYKHFVKALRLVYVSSGMCLWQPKISYSYSRLQMSANILHRFWLQCSKIEAQCKGVCAWAGSWAWHRARPPSRGGFGHPQPQKLIHSSLPSNPRQQGQEPGCCFCVRTFRKAAL